MIRSVLLQFTHRGQTVQLVVSAKGWAQMWLKENPWTSRKTKSRIEYEQAAVQQGLVAVNSILRDWVKGQVTAIESGILSFEAVFMPYTLAPDGRTFIEHIQETRMLPAPAVPLLSGPH